MANAAFYYGLVRALAEAQRPVWTQMSFATAAENLHEAARHGMDARLYWPGLGEPPVAELVLRRLLPLAREGLAPLGRRPSRCRPAAGHHRAALPDRPDRRRLADRRRPQPSPSAAPTAARRCAQMTQRYIEHMHTNEPVHTWPESP